MKWISVNINDRYAVNRVGEVKNLETNKKLNPSFNKAGYRVVSLYDKQTHKRSTIRVHRLVAEAFIANPEGKEDVNHIDGNKANNVVENLEWATRSENMLHKCRVLGKKNQPTFLRLISLCNAWIRERFLKAEAKRQEKPIHSQYIYMSVAREKERQQAGSDGQSCPSPEGGLIHE